MKPIILIISAIFLFSCQDVKEKASETLNKTGEAVGNTATRFVQGVSEGIDQTKESTLSVNNSLIKKGLKYGKFYLSDFGQTNKNVLSVYFIFEKDFSGSLIAKVYDVQNQEYGRVKISLKGKAGEARFVDFEFDKRSIFEAQSRFTVENE
jgi:hypothetical protein